MDVALKCIKVSYRDSEILALARILAYQYHPNVFNAFIEFIRSAHNIELCYSPTTGRLRRVYADGTIIASIRASDGHIIPHGKLVELLHKAIPYPYARVAVVREIVPDILRAHTIFCRHVIDVGPDVRAYDEVLVVDEDDNLIGVGRALLSAEQIITSTYGPAVALREKVGKHGEKI